MSGTYPIGKNSTLTRPFVQEYLDKIALTLADPIYVADANMEVAPSYKYEFKYVGEVLNDAELALANAFFSTDGWDNVTIKNTVSTFRTGDRVIDRNKFFFTITLIKNP